MRYFFKFLLLVLFTHSCETIDEIQNNQPEISYPVDYLFEHDGITRRYTLYKPNNIQDGAPLIFVLHGYGSNAKNIMTYSQMNDIANRNGFAVCYPQGSINYYTSRTHWNANLKQMSNVKDADFLSKLATFLQNEHNLSKENTFVSGMSNGGFMSYTLACNKSDIFSAIASITGTMSGHDWNNCDPEKPIPVLQISGTDDYVVPMDGSMSAAGGWGGAPDINKIIDYWSNLNSCNKNEIVRIANVNQNDNSYVILEKNYNEDQSNEVWLYTIYGGGHTWPGAWGNMDISASEEIWSFFKKYLR